jgi:hypothetical protein
LRSGSIPRRTRRRPGGTYGDARRNSIIGPGSKVFDMAFTKIFPLKEARVLEFRAQATQYFQPGELLLD